MAPVLRQIYDQMSDPSGHLDGRHAASSGGMFTITRSFGAWTTSCRGYLPAGLPPRPEMLLDSIIKLQQRS